MDNYKALMIGEKAPSFQANTTYGMINFPSDYKGKWIVFFSHPGDFTPVCTTELMTFASMAEQFASHNCSLLGLSIDSNPSHISWCRAMEKYQWKNIRDVKITYPIVADDLGTVARMYGMLMPTASATRTVRDVFVIDPEGTIRAILVYPLTTGRNMDEILRLVLALQTYDATGDPTPANWLPGEDQVLPPPGTLPEAQKRLDSQHADGSYCLDWYICFTNPKSSQPKSAVSPTSMKNMMMEDKMKSEQIQPQATVEKTAAGAIPAPSAGSSPQKVFTQAELARYNGKMGMPAYAAVNGMVYDLAPISGLPVHAGLKPGTDLSSEFNTCHMGMNYILSKLPVMGTYAGNPVKSESHENDYIISRDYPFR